MAEMAVQRAGFAEAERLGHHWMGPEHGLLGILRGEPDDITRRALEEAGVDAAMVEGWLDRMGDGTPGDGPPGVSPNPRWYGIYGRAEGFAAALDSDAVGPVHFVLALLWDTRRWPLTEEPGVSRERIVEALARRGVALPPGPLPELERKVRFIQHVEFPLDAADRVIRLLVERHPPGSGATFGFNSDGVDRAWVDAEDGIALQAIVDEALGSGDEED